MSNSPNSPSPVQRNPTTGRPVNEKSSKLRSRSQQLFNSTKQIVKTNTLKVYGSFHSETLEISPQPGYCFVRPTANFLSSCITSISVTLLDFRSKSEYSKAHLRTSLNVPIQYLNNPAEMEPSVILPDQKDVTFQKDVPLYEQKDISSLPLQNFTCLLDETQIHQNKELFLHSWIDDIIAYSKRRKIVHHLVIIDEPLKSKKSSSLPGILHALITNYKSLIDKKKLEILVLKYGFEKIKSEKWLDPNLLASTEAFRKSKHYSSMDFTDDDAYTQVTPFLYLSSSIGATNKQQLESEGITVIVNLTERQITYPDGSFKIVHESMADVREQDIIEAIKHINQIIAKAKQKNGKVLVHCTRGQSRSPIIAIAYLMYARGWSLLRSFLYVREKRPWIGPNPSFMAQLMLYEDALGTCFVSAQFPLHAYTLLESRSEDFDENIEILGLLNNPAQVFFSSVETDKIDKAISFLKSNEMLKYARNNCERDQPPVVFVLETVSMRDKILKLVQLLTDATTVNRDTFDGITPLHFAASTSDVELVAYFLSQGADIAICSLEGKNALHYATQSNAGSKAATLEMITEMLKYATHAKLMCRDVQQFTPSDYAEVVCSTEAIEMLRLRQIGELFSNALRPNPGDVLHVNRVSCFLQDMVQTQISTMLYYSLFDKKMNSSPNLKNPFYMSTQEYFAVCSENLLHASPPRDGSETISKQETYLSVLRATRVKLQKTKFARKLRSLLKANLVPPERKLRITNLPKIITCILIDNPSTLCSCLEETFAEPMEGWDLKEALLNTGNTCVPLIKTFCETFELEVNKTPL